MGADTIVEVGADPTIKVRIQNLQWDIANASTETSTFPFAFTEKLAQTFPFT